jgi:dCTP deaminase
LQPKEFILGWTIERIQLPHASRIAARVEGKSSLARLGMGVHVTATTIHAGFGYDPKQPETGQPIQLEIWNVGTLTIRLVKGMSICQLIFEEVHGTPNKGYGGMFATQAQHLVPAATKV